MPYRLESRFTVFERDAKLDSIAACDADSSSTDRVECERSILVTRLQFHHAAPATNNETQLTSPEDKIITVVDTLIAHGLPCAKVCG